MKIIPSQRGQIAVEAVLITVVMLSLAVFVSNQFRQGEVLSKLVEGPWAYIDGMARYGVWGPPNKVKRLNPYSARRVSSQSEVEQ